MTALVVTSDLTWSSKISAAAHRAGTSVRVAMQPAGVRDLAAECRPGLVILDLSTPGLEPARVLAELAGSVAADCRFLAFAPHVHEALLEEAARAGCAVYTRGQFHAQLNELMAPPAR